MIAEASLRAYKRGLRKPIPHASKEASKCAFRRTENRVRVNTNPGDPPALDEPGVWPQTS